MNRMARTVLSNRAPSPYNTHFECAVSVAFVIDVFVAHGREYRMEIPQASVKEVVQHDEEHLRSRVA